MLNLKEVEILKKVLTVVKNNIDINNCLFILPHFRSFRYTNSMEKNQNKFFHAAFTIKDVFVGSPGGKNGIEKSDSKISFIGCIQDVHINQVSVTIHSFYQI